VNPNGVTAGRPVEVCVWMTVCLPIRLPTMHMCLLGLFFTPFRTGVVLFVSAWWVLLPSRPSNQPSVSLHKKRKTLLNDVSLGTRKIPSVDVRENGPFVLLLSSKEYVFAFASIHPTVSLSIHPSGRPSVEGLGFSLFRFSAFLALALCSSTSLQRCSFFVPPLFNKFFQSYIVCKGRVATDKTGS